MAVSSEYPPAVFVLQRKSLPKHNILVGDDRVQVRFLEQYLNQEAVDTEKVTDDLLLGTETCLRRVSATHRLDLSPDVKARTGIWSADPLTKGSSGLNALVKFAGSLLEIEKLSRESVELVGAEVMRKPIDDIPGAIWQAVWVLTGPMEKPVRWSDPWKDSKNWMDCNDPGYRLNSLYKSLVGWAYLATNETKGARQLGLSPSQQHFLKTLQLDRRKVYESIKVLSQWKMNRSDAFVCALCIATLWA